MKTLLFTLEYPPFKGGIANYYGNLANYWPLGEDLMILNNNQGELILRRGCLAWLRAYGVLKRKIAKSQIDYVIVGQILPLGTVTWLLSLFQPLKYAVFLHGMDLTYALKSPRKRWLARLILERSVKIIAANSCVADKAREFYPPAAEKIFLVNPGVPAGAPAVNPAELQELKTSYKLTGKTVLFSLGRLVKRKGFDKTIEALSLIPKPLINNLIYFIAGTGPQESHLHHVIPAKLTEQIFFLGELSEKEKWNWLKSCDIFIMPARDINGDFEGFGIVYLEANLCGKPVIAGNSGGVGDAVIDGHNGLVVDPEDSESIKRAIVELAGNPDLRNKLGEQGLKRAIQEFNWEAQTAKLVKIINE